MHGKTDIAATDSTEHCVNNNGNNAIYILHTEDDSKKNQASPYQDCIQYSFSTTDGIDVYGGHHHAVIEDKATRMSTKIRTLSGLIVNNERFQAAIVALIVINSIMMGIGTFDFVTENPNVSTAFEIIDLIFLIIFTIELGFQCIYHGADLFKDGWLTFDFIVVFLSWAFSSMQVIRAFRVVRALRLITRIKELRQLVMALLDSVPKMFAVGLLLLLVFYVFAVMFTDLFKSLYRDGYTSQDYFSRLDTTFFTLFQMMTLDSWSSITKEVMKVYNWAWMPFITFVMISSFIVINLIIAVVCDAVAQIHHDESDKHMEEMMSITAPISHTPQEIVRLEKKIDELTKTVQLLLDNQLHLQEAFQVRRNTQTVHQPEMPEISRQL